MDVSEALKKRKSVRAFLQKDVPSEIIQQILNDARHAPSGTNTQPWQVAVVKGKTKSELEQKLEEAFWNKVPKTMDYKYYPDTLAPVFHERRVECGKALYSAVGIGRDDKEKRLKQWALNYSAFGAPVVLYIFSDPCIEKGSYIDLGMFIQSIMLSATASGLATCPQASLAEYPHIVKSALHYPDTSILICGIALGYEDTGVPVNQFRTSREEVDTFTKYYD